MDLNENKIKLKDGRSLGYAEYGDINGKPLFFFHGWPSSRFHAYRISKLATELNIRVIAIDRPGMGLSDFMPNRKLLDFPDDVIELADYLNITKFSIIGVSGGGPYSAVCAYKIPERINKAGIIVGLAPTYIKNICNGMALINKLCWENYGKSSLLRSLAGYTIYFEYLLGNLNPVSPFLSKYDKKMFKPSFSQSMNKDLAESIRKGLNGIIHELKIYSTDWGFELSDIKTKVYLYYGKDDKNVSLAMGKYYKQNLQNSVLTTYEGGHFSWLEHAEEILRTSVK